MPGVARALAWLAGAAALNTPNGQTHPRLALSAARTLTSATMPSRAVVQGRLGEICTIVNADLISRKDHAQPHLSTGRPNGTVVSGAGLTISDAAAIAHTVCRGGRPAATSRGLAGSLEKVDVKGPWKRSVARCRQLLSLGQS